MLEFYYFFFKYLSFNYVYEMYIVKKKKKKMFLWYFVGFEFFVILSLKLNIIGCIEFVKEKINILYNLFNVVCVIVV